MKRFFEHKTVKVFVIILSVFLLFEILFWFFAKPLLKRTISNYLYKVSDSTYILSYDKFRVNLLNGKILLTNFDLSPDTAYIFSNRKEINKNFYQIKLDTFLISKINIFALSKKNRQLLIKRILLSNPDLSIFSTKLSETKKSTLQKKSISIDTLRNDIAKSLFKNFEKVRVRKFEINNGNFDFLKPKADNPNPFSLESITFIINNLTLDKKTFGAEKKDFISNDIEMIIKGYKLKLNDNIHILSSKKIYLSTKKKIIELNNISVKPELKTADELLRLDSNLMNVDIDRLSFKNVDFNRFYLKNELCLNSAVLSGMTAKIYRNAKKTKKINSFDKDTLMNKIDIYALIKNYLHLIRIDTMKIDKGSFYAYSNYASRKPKTQIANLDVEIFNFRVDSTSLKDTSRVLYTKNMLLKMYGFRQQMKDAVHSISADMVVVSTADKGLFASNITILPDAEKKLWVMRNHKSYNYLNIASINVSGFDIFKYAHTNEIDINNLKLSKSVIKMISYGKRKEKARKISIMNMLKTFADKIYIKNIRLEQGMLRYSVKRNNNNLFISGKYRADVADFKFNLFSRSLTKALLVRTFNAYFTKIKFNSPDSIYSLSADSIYYSTNSSKIKFAGLKLRPIEKKLIYHLEQRKKNSVLDVSIPSFSISKTNLNNAFQEDSLYLKQIEMLNPELAITFYPDINPRSDKILIIKKIKRRTIAEIIEQSSKAEVILYESYKKLDSSEYVQLNEKKSAIDTLTTRAVEMIIGLRIKPQKLSKTDTIIPILSEIEKTVNNGMLQLAIDSLETDNVEKILDRTLNEIEHLKNNYLKPKIDKRLIFRAIGNVIPKIVCDSLILRNADFKLNRYTANETNNIFSSQINMRLRNFDFDSSYIDSTNRILFSDDFDIRIKNAVFNLNRDKNKLKIDFIGFNSIDSTIEITGLSYSSSSGNENNQEVAVAKMIMKKVNYNKLYFNHFFVADTFRIEDADIFVKKSGKQEKTKRTFKTIYLPSAVSKLSVNCISISSGNVRYSSDSAGLQFSSKFSLNLNKMYVDSVFNLNRNEYFLPIRDFSLQLENLVFEKKKNDLKLNAKSVFISSDSGFISLKNIYYSTMGDSSLPVLERVKVKNRMKIGCPLVQVKGFNLKKYRSEKDILFEKIRIDSPNIELVKLKAVKNKKTDIQDFDLYKIIGKYTPKISGKNFQINRLSAKVREYTDTTVKETDYPEVSIALSGMKIDSSTTLSEPDLFYAKDVSISVFNPFYYVQDSLYSISAKLIRLSTLHRNFVVEGLQYKPRVSLEDVQKHYKWRTTPVQAEIKRLEAKSIDYKKLVFEKKLKISIIDIDTMFFTAYNDKNYPHNYSVRKKHLIAPVFDAPIPIDIHLISLNNVFVKYREINPKNNQTAHISLDSTNVLVLNITNDTAKIRKKDLYTIIKAHGYINDTAEITFKIYYQLLSEGSIAKVIGEIGECPAKTFNSYTYNGVNLLLDKGVFHRIAFDFKIDDSLAIGKMKMVYNDLRATFISNDTLKRKKLKFVSWLVNTLLVMKNNPKYGIYPKIGKIAYIHDKSFGDIKLWVKSLLSGVQSTIAFNPKDAKKIRKIMRKNKRKMKRIK